MDWFDVMRRFENEDPLAFEQLRTLICAKLVRMGNRRQHDHAEDIVQETMISLLRAWRGGRIREESCFPGFVWKLTERRMVDMWHRHARPGSADCLGDPEQSLTPRALARGQARLSSQLDLRRAFDRLKPAERRALAAVYLEGRTYQETAEWLGLPLGTFKRKLGDSLHRMRAELA